MRQRIRRRQTRLHIALPYGRKSSTTGWPYAVTGLFALTVRSVVSKNRTHCTAGHGLASSICRLHRAARLRRVGDAAFLDAAPGLPSADGGTILC